MLLIPLRINIRACGSVQFSVCLPVHKMGSQWLHIKQIQFQMNLHRMTTHWPFNAKQQSAKVNLVAGEGHQTFSMPNMQVVFSGAGAPTLEI